MVVVVEGMNWVPNHGRTMRFGTQIVAAPCCGDSSWVPKDNSSWLFSTTEGYASYFTRDLGAKEKEGKSYWHPKE